MDGEDFFSARKRKLVSVGGSSRVGTIACPRGYIDSIGENLRPETQQLDERIDERADSSLPRRFTVWLVGLFPVARINP